MCLLKLHLKCVCWNCTWNVCVETALEMCVSKLYSFNQSITVSTHARTHTHTWKHFQRTHTHKKKKKKTTGDCAFSGKPPTAQVASQQGTYLGRVFRDEAANPSKPFSYFHKGVLAYIGSGEAAAALPKPKFGTNYFANLWEAHAHQENEQKNPSEFFWSEFLNFLSE